jgi:putative ABC transport system permease protein
VGVIDDYSYRPNYDKSKEVVFNYDPDRFNAMLIHIRPDNQKATTMMVENVWKKLCPDIPFVADFLVNEMKNDIIILKLHSLQSFISAIAAFSFLIALLGLFGLSIISAEQRVKEISIRRVNGALITDLLILMNRRFIYLVIISIAISFPLIFFITEEIKKDSEKPTSLSWVYYVITAIVILTLALLTVSWQSWKAATKNPMDAFRNE